MSAELAQANLVRDEQRADGEAFEREGEERANICEGQPGAVQRSPSPTDASLTPPVPQREPPEDCCQF